MDHHIYSFDFLDPNCGPVAWSPAIYTHLMDIADYAVRKRLILEYKDSECMQNRLVPCDGACPPVNPSYPIVNRRYQAKCWQWTTYDPTNGLKKLAPCTMNIGCVVYARMCYIQRSSTWFDLCWEEAGRSYPADVPISCPDLLPLTWDSDDCFSWCP
ncbi:MAG: hypothetical protein J0M05_10930 [Candidatus Kapabacteria bacterium]|nr:hypothetical protein [Candidatus Kapabacteria bacterium]